jgi:hypothetical protein
MQKDSITEKVEVIYAFGLPPNGITEGSYLWNGSYVWIFGEKRQQRDDTVMTFA